MRTELGLWFLSPDLLTTPRVLAFSEALSNCTEDLVGSELVPPDPCYTCQCQVSPPAVGTLRPLHPLLLCELRLSPFPSAAPELLFTLTFVQSVISCLHPAPNSVPTTPQVLPFSPCCAYNRIWHGSVLTGPVLSSAVPCGSATQLLEAAALCVKVSGQTWSPHQRESRDVGGKGWHLWVP